MFWERLNQFEKERKRKKGRKELKLSSCYIGPFEILERIGKVAYRLVLSPNLANVNNIFHVSMLKRYMHSPSQVINFEPLHVRKN